jgi:hypothetical protein
VAAAALLHVGEDTCHRIPVMEASGLFVMRAECSIGSIRGALKSGRQFSIVTFHNDVVPPPIEAVTEARSVTAAALVLFENPSVACNERDFDLVISAHTPPEIWLQSLRMTIQNSRRICDKSRQLRVECEEVCATARELRAAANRRNLEFDSMSAWRGETDIERRREDATLPLDSEPLV